MRAPVELNALPAPIQRALRGRDAERIGLGESGADVLRFAGRGLPPLYLKTQEIGSGPPLRSERDRLLWMKGHVAASVVVAPEVVEWVETDARECLVMSAVPGVPASELVEGRDARRVARLVGETLRQLHDVATDDCPFDVGPDAMLAAARRNVERGWVVVEDFDDGRLGRSAEDVLAEAHRTRPADRAGVFVHGDPYPQNVLIADDGVGGLIDWGSAGVGDPWRDLALATIAFEERAGFAVAAELLAAYGVEAPDRERSDWWRLMDELC